LLPETHFSLFLVFFKSDYSSVKRLFFEVMTRILLILALGIFSLMIGAEIFLQSKLATPTPEIIESRQSAFSELIQRNANLSTKQIPYENRFGKGEILTIKLNSKAKFSIANQPKNPQRVSAWALECENCLVMNAAYFDRDFEALGGIFVEGKSMGKKFFDENLSAMAIFDQKAAIRDLSMKAFLRDESGEISEDFSFAVQSYPLLLRNGVAAISKDSGLLARRSAVATDKNGDFYLIFANQSHLSLYELAQILAQSELNFMWALNFDGGPSSGLIANFDGQILGFDSYEVVPSVLVVEF
jgi:exopolysaccharide biosynthesis protein